MKVRNVYAADPLNMLGNVGQALTANGKKLIDQILKHDIYIAEIGKDSEWAKKLGMNEDDLIIVKIESASVATFQENRLSVFFHEKAQQFQMGFAYDNFGEISVRYITGNIIRYKKKDITYVGYVFQIIKPYQPPEIYGESEPKAALLTESEMSVICDNCKTTASGSREFLRAMAWQLMKDKTLCASCW